jgi:hypothetical protein
MLFQHSIYVGFILKSGEVYVNFMSAIELRVLMFGLAFPKFFFFTYKISVPVVVNFLMSSLGQNCHLLTSSYI